MEGPAEVQTVKEALVSPKASESLTASSAPSSTSAAYKELEWREILGGLSKTVSLTTYFSGDRAAIKGSENNVALTHFRRSEGDHTHSADLTTLLLTSVLLFCALQTIVIVSYENPWHFGL